MHHEREWERAFRASQPRLPEGFEQRQDALLTRLRAGQGAVRPRPRRLRWAIALALASVTLAGVAAGGLGRLERFFASLNWRLDSDTKQALQLPLKQHSYQTEDLHLQVNDMLSDGRWVHLAAEVQPRHDQLLLVEQEEGPAPFLQRAQAGGQRLIRLSLYLEYEPMNEYMMSSERLPDGGLALYASGDVVPTGEQMAAQLRLITEELDIHSGAAQGRQEQLYPLSLPVQREEQSRRYALSPGGPVEQITLTRTALCTYMALETRGAYSYELLDAQGQPYEPGIAFSGWAYRMDSLPERIRLKVTDHGKDEVLVLTGQAGETEEDKP